MARTIEITLALTVLGAMAVPSRAEPPRTGAADCSRITIRIWDPIPVKAATLERAKRVTARVFVRSGIDIVWLDCAMDGPPSCSTPRGPGEISLRICRRSKEARRAIGNHVGGAALTGDRGAQIVHLFYDALEGISSEGTVPLELALGITASHEIGHLLIGRGHSPRGIMSPTLEGADWHRAAQGALLFTRQEAALLRSGVCRGGGGQPPQADRAVPPSPTPAPPGC